MPGPGETSGAATPDYAGFRAVVRFTAAALKTAVRERYFRLLNLFRTSGQFTALHHAAMYSGRRFWYFR